MTTPHYLLRPTCEHPAKASHASLRTDASDSEIDANKHVTQNQAIPLNLTSSNRSACRTTSGHQISTSLELKSKCSKKANTLKNSKCNSASHPVDDEIKKYKTELCKNFEETGRCKFGKKCKFAHGKEEMKVKAYVGLQYKTKPCEKFYNLGFCPYGNRCLYLHDCSQTGMLETFCEKVLAVLQESPQEGIRKVICEQQSK